MPGITKTMGTVLCPVTLITSGASDRVSINPPAPASPVGSVDVSTKIAATIYMHFGLTDISHALTDGVELRVEASATASGDAQWFPIATYKTSIGPPVSAVVSGMTSNLLSVTSASTSFAAGQYVFIQHSTLGSSEWHRIKSTNIVGTTGTITLIDIPATSMTGAAIYNQAEMYTAQLDLSAIGRIRFVADASSTGAYQVAFEAYLTTGDSVS